MSVNANNSTKEVDKLTIRIKKHAEYPTLMKGGVISSYELMEQISELFSIYDDFYSCYVTPRTVGYGFDVSLYFTEPQVSYHKKDEDILRAFINKGAEEKNRDGKVSIINTLNSLERRNTSRMYNLTDDGYEGLIDFFTLPKGKDRKEHLNPFIKEVNQNANINNGVFAVVTGLDINKILAAIYGNTENGEYVQYQLTPIRPLGQINPMSPNAAMDWILSIQRIGMKELNKVTRKVGLVQNNGIPMVTRRDLK